MHLRKKLLCVAVIGWFGATAFGKFAMVGEDVPVDRLITNVSQYVNDHPKDAKGHYLLGRVNALAYAKNGGQVRTSPDKDDPNLPVFMPYETVQVRRPKPDEELSPAAREYLVKSLAEYSQAVTLDPKDGLYQLGYGWMLQQASVHAEAETDNQATTKPTTQPAESLGKPEDLRDRALEAYEKAFSLRLTADIETEDRMQRGDAFVAAEAARDAMEILRSRPQTDETAKQIARYEKGIKDINAKGMAKTPIILPMHGQATLEELLASPAAAPVTFDIAGDGINRQWPWVKPGTALLVWDGGQTGRVTSGRQLFGSVTWWMFWHDGYEPLAMLDDNHDGALSGKELDRLALWVDRNGDGVSDVGEVMSVTSAGVGSIGVTPTRDRSGVLTNAAGIHWRDGTTSPTYDWTPQSLPAQSPQ